MSRSGWERIGTVTGSRRGISEFELTSVRSPWLAGERIRSLAGEPGESGMSTTKSLTERQTWTIDAAHTQVEFLVKHMMISTVRGRFGQVEGSVVSEDGEWAVEVRLEAASIDTRVEQRDAHLRSGDFLDAETHPHLVFRGRSDEGGFEEPGDTFQVAGELTIRGITRPVVLDVTYGGSGRDPWGGERLSFNATAAFDRREYGLTWNQALETGGVLVSNEVRLNLDVQVVRA
jgi:polyisoprenoid-binding protein YceI